jgi:hypothetical protein
METLESPFLWHTRRPGLVIGAVAAIAGLVAWLSGWRDGHSLTTLALLVMIVGSIDGKYSPHFAAGRAYCLQAVKSREQDDYDGALSAVATLLKGLRRLAAKYPEGATPRRSTSNGSCWTRPTGTRTCWPWQRRPSPLGARPPSTIRPGGRICATP